MSVERNKIIKFCTDYLQVEKFSDYCVNGLQVEGAPKVSRIIIGVSLSEKLIKVAIKKKAQMIIVHHGIFKDKTDQPPSFQGVLAKRLKLLLANNINLAGFHLPLDAHPIIGNNISLCKIFGVKNPQPFDLGFIGALERKTEFKEFAKIVAQKLNTKTYIIPAGPRYVSKIGIISGGASDHFPAALAAGADTYLCGDVREEVVEAVKEMKINFINAGHYNTEKIGIKNLGDLVAKKFKVKVEFIDISCEI
jgi:dinuclear metal center YbgI/SA1388 family protein